MVEIEDDEIEPGQENFQDLEVVGTSIAKIQAENNRPSENRLASDRAVASTALSGSLAIKARTSEQFRPSMDLV